MLQKEIASALVTFKDVQMLLIAMTFELAVLIIVSISRHEKERDAYLSETEEARHRAETNEQWMTTTMNSMGDGVIITDAVGKVEYLNPVATSLTGWKMDDARGLDVREVFNIVNQETGAVVDNPLAKVIKENIVVGLANHTVLISKDSRRTPIADTGAPIFGSSKELVGMVLVFHDISERHQYESELKASLKEKETLLKEIHHRVKNNMAIISSLNSLQSKFIDDERLSRVFEEGRNRIKAMSLVHEKLYQSESLSKVNVRDYLQSVCENLYLSFGLGSDDIELKITADSFSINLNTLIPIGLIVNELVTNALKYAFEDMQGGAIELSLGREHSGKFTLVISDNGVGVPEGVDFNTTNTLGLQLVNTLVLQLGADIELDRTGGSTYRITFVEQD